MTFYCHSPLVDVSVCRVVLLPVRYVYRCDSSEVFLVLCWLCAVVLQPVVYCQGSRKESLVDRGTHEYSHRRFVLIEKNARMFFFVTPRVPKLLAPV